MDIKGLSLGESTGAGQCLCKLGEHEGKKDAQFLNWVTVGRGAVMALRQHWLQVVLRGWEGWGAEKLKTPVDYIWDIQDKMLIR